MFAVTEVLVLYMCLVFVEEDAYNLYAKFLIKYFLAEGVMCGHALYVARPYVDAGKILKVQCAPYWLHYLCVWCTFRTYQLLLVIVQLLHPHRSMMCHSQKWTLLGDTKTCQSLR